MLFDINSINKIIKIFDGEKPKKNKDIIQDENSETKIQNETEEKNIAENDEKISENTA